MSHDIRLFHDGVLGAGARPLDVLTERVDQRVAMAGFNSKHQAAAFIIVLVAALTTRADTDSVLNAVLSAFAGTWKEDLSKTVRRPPDDLRKYEQNSDGTMTVTIGGNVYHDTFRIDGKPHPSVPQPGVMQTWTQTSPSIWESTDTKDGQVINTIRRIVSSNGKTLTNASTYKSKDGQSLTYTTVYTRISNEKRGLVGTWKALSVRADAPDVFTFRVTPDGALSYSGMGATFIAKPDGKQYPVKAFYDGVSLRSPGSRQIEITFFTKGKPFEIDTMMLSPDGQSFNEVDRDPSKKESTGTMVYRK